MNTTSSSVFPETGRTLFLYQAFRRNFAQDQVCYTVIQLSSKNLNAGEINRCGSLVLDFLFFLEHCTTRPFRLTPGGSSGLNLSEFHALANRNHQDSSNGVEGVACLDSIEGVSVPHSSMASTPSYGMQSLHQTAQFIMKISLLFLVQILSSQTWYNLVNLRCKKKKGRYKKD